MQNIKPFVDFVEQFGIRIYKMLKMCFALKKKRKF